MIVLRAEVDWNEHDVTRLAGQPQEPLETAVGTLWEEDDRSRWMSLGQSGEDVLGRLDPLFRHPGDVRHHTRAQVRARLFVDAQRSELVLDLGDAG